MSAWIDPLTGVRRVPTGDGELMTVAVAYWEDELYAWRGKRPRTVAGKSEKEAAITKAIDRIGRFRRERDRLAIGLKVSRTSVQLATDDLTTVMETA